MEHLQSAAAEAVDDLAVDGIEGDDSSDALSEAFAPLTNGERRFVNAAVSGKDWKECADAAGITTNAGIARMLGRVRVRTALEIAAPLLGSIDPRLATKLLRPYMFSKLTETAFHAGEAQSTQAIKELIAIDGIAAKGDRAAASLMDILASVERRISARTVDAEVVKVPELPASAGDSESRQAIGIATIPGDADAASGASSGDASGAVGRRGRRRGRKPRP